MGALMTEHDYGQERAGLVAAIARAEIAARDAAYRQRTDTGRADETQAAKDHLASLKEQLADLDAAWAGSLSAARRERADDRQERYQSFVAETEALLQEREQIVGRLPGGIEAVLSDIARYQEIAGLIRAGAQRLNTCRVGQAANAMSALSMALLDAATMVVSDKLREAQFNMAPNTALAPLAPVEFERRTAAAVLRALQAYAPDDPDAPEMEAA